MKVQGKNKRGKERGKNKIKKGENAGLIYRVTHIRTRTREVDLLD